MQKRSEMILQEQVWDRKEERERTEKKREEEEEENQRKRDLRKYQGTTRSAMGK